MSESSAAVTTPAVDRSRWHSLYRLRTYLRPYRAQFLWMLAFALVVEFASLSIPFLTQRIVDGPLTDGDTAGLWLLGGLAVWIGVVEAVAGFARRWIQCYCALDVETTIRNDLYRHLQRLPVAYHDGTPTGQLITRATNDLATIRRFFGFGLIFLVVLALFFAAVIAQMLYLFWPLGLLVLLTSIPVAVVTTRFEVQYSRAARLCQDLEGDVATVVEESAVGIRVIKSLGRSDVVGRRFTGETRRLQSATLGKIRVLAKFWSVLDAVPQLVLAAVLIIGAAAVAYDALSLGALAAFVALTVLMAWPVQAFGWILALGQEAATSADRLYDVLDTVPAVRDRDDARPLPAGPGRLSFHDVRFAFPDSEREVLRGVDLVVEPGQTVALVAATGSGKTALLSLVPRLYDVTGGAIRLDGIDLRELTLDSLRAAVAVAFEDPTLFSASVRENLTLGRPEASDTDVAEAIDVAQAEFVYELPWGLETRIGEQGHTLSGGQRQRLALARAVLGRPRLLILDDPLSALDIHTEALVEDALRRVLTGTTALVVAHRASTVLLADRVALLENGVITAFGTHSELMATVPAYQALLSADAELAVGA